MGLRDQMGDIRLLVFPIITILIISISTNKLFWEFEKYEYYLYSLFSSILVIVINAFNLPLYYRKFLYLILRHKNREQRFKVKYFKLMAYDIKSEELKLNDDLLVEKTFYPYFQRNVYITYSAVIFILVIINFSLILTSKKFIFLYLILYTLLLLLVLLLASFRITTLKILLIFNFLQSKTIPESTKSKIIDLDSRNSIIDEIKKVHIKTALKLFKNVTK